MPTLILSLFVLGLFFCLIELRHRLRPSSPIKLRLIDWEVKKSNINIRVKGYLEIVNPHPKMEVMIPNLSIKPLLLGKSGTQKNSGEPSKLTIFCKKINMTSVLQQEHTKIFFTENELFFSNANQKLKKSSHVPHI